MSKNNSIIKSDKKFIAREKSRIRRDFLDTKKQQELIDALYARFMPKDKTGKAVEPKNAGAKANLPAGKEVKKEAPKAAPKAVKKKVKS